MPFILSSDPYHARAEYLRHKYVTNPNMTNFGYVAPGDVGIVVGSLPHYIYLFQRDHKIKLFRMAEPYLPDEVWDWMYGREFMVISSLSSDIGFHALEEIIEKDEAVSNMEWESPAVNNEEPMWPLELGGEG